MPEWGPEGQKKLSEAKVVCIGSGGVKSTLLLCLVSCGIGEITIIDSDKVELSNLNRQFLFNMKSIGKNKASASKKFLSKINPDIKIHFVEEEVTDKNIDRLCSGFDFLIEGGSSPFQRNTVNRFCLKTKTPFVHASAQFSYGYVFSVMPELGTACFECFFPNDVKRRASTGPVPVNCLSTSIAGSIGASEVVKYFLGYKEEMFVGKMLCFSSLLLNPKFEIIKVKQKKECCSCGKKSKRKEVIV
jgi:adenylyltransferase/sulfurtransferase